MKLHLLFFSAFLSINIACNSQPSKSSISKRPNIVLILADDLGYGDLGAYGQQLIETPHLDRLAKQGLRFMQFYAGSTVCAPSRSALMTGKHTGHTYIRGNKEAKPEGQEPLADSIVTLAEILKSTGYVTGAYGKWGLGPVGSPGDPLNQGFDTFYGYNCQRYAHRYYPEHLWDNDKKVILEGNDLRQTVHYAPDLIQQQALSFIEKYQHEPFFLFLPYILPHAELIVPDDSLYRQYVGRFEEKPHKGNDYGPNATVPGYTSQEYPRATYAAMVSRLDHYVGQVVAKLEALGIAENTLVLFASDNGPAREGGTDPQFFNSAGGLRGFKRDMYEGGIRSPLIAWWPGKVKAGTQSQHIGAAWDLYPTFAELAGTSVPDNVDGISMLPTLLETGDQAQHDYLYWEFHELGGRQAVRKGDWKAVRLQAKENPNGPLELYNLATDKTETTNVADQHPEIVRELGELLKQRTRSSFEVWNF